MKSFKKLLIGILAIWITWLPQLAYASNTHSADIELSSSQGFTAADHADFTFTTDVTFEGWVKYETKPVDGDDGTMALLFKGSSPDISWRIIDVNNGIKMCTSAVGNNINCTALKDKGTFVTGTWYKWSVVYHQSAGTADYCFNGTDIGQGITGLNTSIYDGTTAMAIGRDPDALDRFDGLMDEIRISNTARYTAGDCPIEDDNFTNDANTLALWHFDGAADFLTDSSSNGHTLTNVNTATQTTDVPYAGAGAAAVVPRKRPDIIFFN